MTSLFNSRFLHGQDSEYDSLLAVYLKLDSAWIAEFENDSLNIFAILDNLVSSRPKSQLAIRSSYNSQVYNAGRDYDIDQYSFSNGISYYHKSGIYADLSGLYYSSISPHYNATSVTLGFSNFISTKWGFNVNATRTFYHELEEDASFNNTLNYNLGVSTFYYSKYVIMGLDYAYSFGSENTKAHRLVPSITFAPKLNTKGFLKRFKFNPIVYATFGTETLYTEQYNYLVARSLIQKIGRERFLRALQNEDERLLNLIYDTQISKYFGPLNIQMTFPIQYHYKKFTGLVSYNVNMPIKMPGEDLDERMSGYFGVSLYYLFSQ